MMKQLQPTKSLGRTYIQWRYQSCIRMGTKLWWTSCLGRTWPSCRCIDSFIKAKNPREYDQIIKVAEEQNEYNALVQFLQPARQMLNRNEIIDTKLCYAYAKTNMLNELKELISSPNAIRIKEVADRCFNDKLFEACNILYTVINDTTKLAEILNLMNPK